MANLITDFWNFVKRILGIESEDDQEMKSLRQMRARLLEEKRTRFDAQETLKEDIARLEARAKSLNHEFQAKRGPSRRLVARQIEGVFREIDLTRGREELLASSIDKVSLAVAKIDEAMAGQIDVTQDLFDDIALTVRDVHDRHREADRAARELEEETYSAPDATRVSAESRLSEVTDEADIPEDLSVEVKRRLRELEAE